MVHVSATPVLALRGVSKRFGAVQALTDVELEVHAGEVVALVGDNGAGKSTLVKTIAGVHPIDEGVIEWEGRSVQINKPHDAQNLGIATVYQDLALCDNIDVVGNLYLGRELQQARRPRRGRDGAPRPRAAADPVDPHPQRAHPDRLALRRPAPDRGHRPLHARRAQAGHPRRAHRRPRRRADRAGPRPGRAAARARPRRHPHQPQHGRREGRRRQGRRAAAGPQQRRLRRQVAPRRKRSSPPSPAPRTTP